MRIKKFWSYIREYRLKKTFFKNLIITLILGSSPVIAMSMVFYFNTVNIVESEIRQTSKSTLSGMRDISDTIMYETEKMVIQLSNQNFIQSFFISEPSPYIADDIQSKVESTIRMFTLTYDYMDSIYVYSQKNGTVVANNELGSKDNFSDMGWLEMYNKMPVDTTACYLRKRNNIYPYYLTFIRKVSGGSGEYACVVANINVEIFAKTIRNYDESSNQMFLVIDDAGNIVMSDKIEYVSNNIESFSEFERLPLDKNESTTKEFVGKQQCIVSIVKSNKNGMRYISIINMDSVQNKIWDVLLYVINTIIICIIASLFIQFGISAKLFQPFNRIISVIYKNETDELSSTDGNNDNVDEIKALTNKIIRTIDANLNLRKELEIRLGLLNKAKAAALQAQINPHFLYNSLETINWLAFELTGKRNDVSDMIMSLANFLRVSMDMEEHVISLSDEVNCAKLYIDVIMRRYSDILEVQWDIPTELLSYKILKLTIQPLVENAIYHGIKPMRRLGTVLISAKALDDEIIISVEDNGVGMTQQELEQVNSDLKNEYKMHGEHMGLLNVNQRIKLIFGEEYGVNIFSVKGSGTQAKISVPKII